MLSHLLSPPRFRATLDLTAVRATLGSYHDERHGHGRTVRRTAFHYNIWIIDIAVRSAINVVLVVD